VRNWEIKNAVETVYKLNVGIQRCKSEIDDEGLRASESEIVFPT